MQAEHQTLLAAAVITVAVQELPPQATPKQAHSVTTVPRLPALPNDA